MQKVKSILSVGLAATWLTACSGSSIQQSIEPPVSTPVNPITQTTLQFEVGTANVAGTVGLNTLETYRQNVGQHVGASILTNAPTIVGPSGFKVPSASIAPDAYGDAGTNQISGAIQTSITNPPPATTFDPASGPPPYAPSGALDSIASSYGFLPAAVTNGAGQTPGLMPAALPYYVGANPVLSCPSSSCNGGGRLLYIGGPPAFVPPGHTSTQDGTFVGGYPGYTLGFVDFQAAPVSGVYTLNVVVPTGINPSTGQSQFGTKTATATLAASKVLPAWSTAPAFTSDGTGGGTIALNYAGAGSSEVYVELVNNGPAKCQLSGSPPYYYTFKLAPGTTTVSVPDNIGAAPPKAAQPHTLCTATDDASSTGDGVSVYGFAVDFPLFESAFPQSQGLPAPVLVGSAGQDDVSSSAASAGAE